METYLQLEVSAEESVLGTLHEVLNAMQDYDLDTSRELLSDLDESLAPLFDQLVQRFGDYIEGIEDIEEGEGGLSASFVCGGEGLEYAVALLPILGRHATRASIAFDHDEEHEEDEEDVRLTYSSGQVLLNGKPVSV